MLSIVQGKPLELPFMAVLSFVKIPVELLIITIFQKYSSHVNEIVKYQSLQPGDFDNE